MFSIKKERKRKMKKLLLLALVFTLGASLAACGGGTDEPDPDPLTCTAPQVLNDAGDACVDPVEPCEPTVSVDGVWMNKNLRVALSYSIDRELIAETLGAGQVPAGGFVPPGFLDHNGLDFFEVAGTYGLETDDTNFAEAVQLFALAAEEMGMTVQELRDALEQEELLFNTSEGHQTVAQLVQQAWESNLGFTIPLANEEWAVFQDTRSQGNF